MHCTFENEETVVLRTLSNKSSGSETNRGFQSIRFCSKKSPDIPNALCIGIVRTLLIFGCIV